MKVINAPFHLARHRTPPPGAGEPAAAAARGRIARAVGALIAALALTACSTGGADFSEYEGVDLISTRSRDASLWYFADGLNLETDTTAAFDYVEFEEVAAAVYGTLPDGVAGPVYRLEVVNLFRDGTFEENDEPDGADHLTTGGSALGWVEGNADGMGSARATLVESDGITGQSLRLDFENRRVYYAADLTRLLSDGFPAGSSYAFHMDFRSRIQTFGIQLHDNDIAPIRKTIDQDISRGSLEDAATVYAYPGSGGANPDIVDASAESGNVLLYDADYPYFSFGGFDTTVQASINTDIDNIRFVRGDQNHYARLPVPLSEGGRPDLVPGGSYTVSLWVRDDPVVGGTAAPNRIPARFFSIGIDQRINDPTPVSRRSAADGTQRYYVGDLSGWRRLSATFNTGTLTFSAAATAGTAIILDVTLEIGQSGDATAFRDAGSVLVTGLSLEWSPSIR